MLAKLDDGLWQIRHRKRTPSDFKQVHMLNSDTVLS